MREGRWLERWLVLPTAPHSITQDKNTVPIYGIEPLGAACFYHSMQINRQDPDNLALSLPEGATSSHVEVTDPPLDLTREAPSNVKSNRVSLVHLAGITSRASSLGTSSPSPGAVSMALQRKGPVRCIAISDERAMGAALKFAGTYLIPEAVHALIKLYWNRRPLCRS
jgi:L-serine/L-threonine ammonia-lyase